MVLGNYIEVGDAATFVDSLRYDVIVDGYHDSDRSLLMGVRHVSDVVLTDIDALFKNHYVRTMTVVAAAGGGTGDVRFGGVGRYARPATAAGGGLLMNVTSSVATFGPLSVPVGRCTLLANVSVGRGGIVVGGALQANGVRVGGATTLTGATCGALQVGGTVSAKDVASSRALSCAASRDGKIAATPFVEKSP